MPDFPTLNYELPFTATRVIRVSEGEADGGRYAYSWDSTALLKWELQFTALSTTGRSALIAFWEARGGPYETFSFTDPDTNTAHTVRFVGDTLDIRWTSQMKAEIRVVIQKVR